MTHTRFLRVSQAGGVPGVLDSPQLIPFVVQGSNNQPSSGAAAIQPSPRSFIRQCYEVAHAPVGFVLKLVLLSTWGDPHYIGLNGIEVYDSACRPLRLRPRVSAVPYSVNSLPGANANKGTDIRTPDKLANGVNCTWEDKNMWLAPFEQEAPGKQIDNVVYAVWDEAVPISLIKLWNYSKTPSRGVNELMVFVDDALVFCGAIQAAPPSPNRGGNGEDFGQCIRCGPGHPPGSSNAEQVRGMPLSSSLSWFVCTVLTSRSLVCDASAGAVVR